MLLTRRLIALFAAVGLLAGADASAEVPFERTVIAPGEAEWWWARCHRDVNGDGLVDFCVVNNNAWGGWLGWYEAIAGPGAWERRVIAEAGPDGGTFACGDLDAADIDGDGDVDVLGPVSPGEWGGASSPTRMYWYENPGWRPHYIGEFPSFVKDVDLVDLNGDGRVDLAATCFETHQMIVYRQDTPEEWTQVAEVYVDTLHEGQHVGDLDGDGDTDVVSTAFWFENPGADMTGEWVVRNIDPYWNSDEGRGWKHNSTKIVCRDIDDDGRDEVFISCSEAFRDRVAWYDSADPRAGGWVMHPIGKNTFAHTLQVGDVEGDGDLDVLSGSNGNQGDPNKSPVLLFLNQGDNTTWVPQTLTTQGAYNSALADADGDGDLDFFRYSGHQGVDYELWINRSRDAPAE